MHFKLHSEKQKKKSKKSQRKKCIINNDDDDRQHNKRKINKFSSFAFYQTQSFGMNGFQHYFSGCIFLSRKKKQFFLFCKPNMNLYTASVLVTRTIHYNRAVCFVVCEKFLCSICCGCLHRKIKCKKVPTFNILHIVHYGIFESDANNNM